MKRVPSFLSTDPVRPVRHPTYIRCLARYIEILAELPPTVPTHKYCYELAELSTGISSHLESAACQTCRRQRNRVLEEMPHEERLLLARCIHRARVIESDFRTAEAFMRLMDGSQSHGGHVLIALDILKKYGPRAGDFEGRRAETIRFYNAALDRVWPLIRDYFPEDAIPASRRVPRLAH